MHKKIGIAGVYQTKHESSKKKQSLTELVFEAAHGALVDSGFSFPEVDSVVLAAHDLIDGRSITSMLTAPPAGAYMKDEIRVADDGAIAVALAWLRLLSGDFNVSLVVSWSKLSEIDFDAVCNLNFDPMYYRPLGLSYNTAHALQASTYCHRYNIHEEQAARVVVKNRFNAGLNPFAHLQESVGLNDVLESPLLAWPLKALDLPPKSDGACALVLATEDRIDKGKRPCAWINGVGWCNDTYHLGDKTLSSLGSLKLAAEKAYRMAGINDPVKELQVAEIHDLTSFHELMTYEALGFCAPGAGGRFVDEGVTRMEGEIPVSPSGGILSSHPYTAAGLIRVAEAALQVMGRAGKRQIPSVRTALGHGAGGMASQSNCVVILGEN